MDSPLVYVGGKSKLSKEIISLIPTHTIYCEVFAGAGWVFFRKEPSKSEVLNDLDSDLISFYRVLQNHLEEFLKQFKWLLQSREQFEDWKSQLDGRGLTDIQKAARYYYLQRLCFGGRVSGRSFGVSPDRPGRINLLRLEEELSDVHLRLYNVMIENLPWNEFIDRYDRTETFFFLDPPYYESPVYKHNFYKIDDYIKIAAKLKTVRGNFILTLNDHPEIRKVFADFFIKPVNLAYSVGVEKTVGSELIITREELMKDLRLW